MFWEHWYNRDRLRDPSSYLISEDHVTELLDDIVKKAENIKKEREELGLGDDPTPAGESTFNFIFCGCVVSLCGGR